MKRILVVDDEASILSLLGRVLNREGFQVLPCKSGRKGLALAAQEKPDLIILDLNLPDLYGEDVCQQIRRQPETQNIPILILTGKSDDGLSARCLNGGADAYLSKPFEIADILAHVRALLRRPHLSTPEKGVVRQGQLMIRVNERRVFWNGRKIGAFPPKEFDLLRHLVTQTPKVIDKNTLALKVWGVPYEQLHQRTLDVHMRRIRKKLGPKAAECLKTVPAIGFQWFEDISAPDVEPTPANH